MEWHLEDVGKVVVSTKVCCGARRVKLEEIPNFRKTQLWNPDVFAETVFETNMRNDSHRVRCAVLFKSGDIMPQCEDISFA